MGADCTTFLNHFKAFFGMFLTPYSQGAFIVCSLPTTIIIVTLLIDPDHKAGTLEPLHYNIIHWVLLGKLIISRVVTVVAVTLDRNHRLVTCATHALAGVAHVTK